jgi:hypothetical protein
VPETHILTSACCTLMNKKRCITVSRKNLSTLSCLLSRRRKKPPNLPKFGARPLQSSKQHGACPTHQTSHFCVRPLLSAKQHALHPPPSTYLYITWISPPPPLNSLGRTLQSIKQLGARPLQYIQKLGGAHSKLSSNSARTHFNQSFNRAHFKQSFNQARTFLPVKQCAQNLE